MAMPKIRLNLEISPEEENIIEKIAYEERTTKSGIIRQSINLMKYFADLKKHGSKVMVIDEDGKQKEFLYLLND